ncbi:MAG: 16S rRNA (guanine(527)-N(7))-methyltransferase RsmG [Mycobacteriaceae bacterium]
MFHVEQMMPLSEELQVACKKVFGDRLDLAIKYYESLASEGVTRGLIGPKEVPRLWERHLLNCAVIGELIGNGERVVDIGSGAGLPGIPLAIARPDLHISLVEPLLRRTTYLIEFIEKNELAVEVIRGRAEETKVIQQLGGADVVTSRAVAPLDKLAFWSIPLAKLNGKMIAIKGSSAAEEISKHQNSLLRIGTGKLEVMQCGVGLLPTPTTVVRGVRIAKSQKTR